MQLHDNHKWGEIVLPVAWWVMSIKLRDIFFLCVCEYIACVSHAMHGINNVFLRGKTIYLIYR